MTTFNDIWTDVRTELDNAKGISFDGCHKIYILLDDHQVRQSAEWGYGEDGSFLITDLNADEMLTTLQDWYSQSCGLRFIESVKTVLENPNLGYTHLIPQGYESQFCDACGEDGADYSGYCSDCYDSEDLDECETCGTSMPYDSLDSNFNCEYCADEMENNE